MTTNENDSLLTPDGGPPFPQTGGPRGTWDFGRALIFFAFLAGGTMVLGVALMVAIGFKLSALLSELSLYLAVPFLLSRFLNTEWSTWIRRPRWAAGSWGWMLLALLGLGVLVSNIPVAVDRIYPMSEEYKQFFEQYLRADSLGELGVLFLVAAIVPGICEEITFRGLIQTGIRATYGASTAVVVTSLLFAAIHLSIWNFPALILMGVFLGMLKERTGSVWPGAVAHVINNAIALGLMTAAPPSEHAWQYEFFPWWVNAPAAAAFGLGIFRLLRRKPGAAVVGENPDTSMAGVG